jgi:hypothetical protein
MKFFLIVTIVKVVNRDCILKCTCSGDENAYKLMIGQ